MICPPVCLARAIRSSLASNAAQLSVTTGFPFFKGLDGRAEMFGWKALNEKIGKRFELGNVDYGTCCVRWRSRSTAFLLSLAATAANSKPSIPCQGPWRHLCR